MVGGPAEDQVVQDQGTGLRLLEQLDVLQGEACSKTGLWQWRLHGRWDVRAPIHRASIRAWNKDYSLAWSYQNTWLSWSLLPDVVAFYEGKVVVHHFQGLEYMLLYIAAPLVCAH